MLAAPSKLGHLVIRLLVTREARVPVRKAAKKSGSTLHGADAPVFLRILGYEEHGQWVALVLEMDLRGYGRTFNSARAHLEEFVTMQISFAQFKQQPELIWHPAEPGYFVAFQEAMHSAVTQIVKPSNRSQAMRVSGLRLPTSASLPRARFQVA